PPVRPHRWSSWSPWRVQTPRLPGGPSAIGPRVQAPRQSANAALVRPSAPVVAGVFSHQAAGQPPRVESGRNATPADPVACTAHVAAGCAAAQPAPAVAPDGGPGIRAGEPTRRQAPAPAPPAGPRPPGRGERPAYAALRQGPPCCLPTCDVARGAGVPPPLGPSRPAADWAAHLARTIATDPEAPGLFIVAHPPPPQSEAWGRLVASACASAEALGEQEQRGLWQSMSPPAAFWRAVSHRLPCLYTPKHTSWLNHIERWCSLLVRRLLRRGNCTSVAD